MAHRSSATVVLSLAPGSFVVDARGDELVLHTLVDGRPRLDRRVTEEVADR